ncbi:MAG: hypothetical protein OXH93_19490 [Caldilineaceae bacterium]|nr:hypothetical protein [Caldilineaceae bacterium]
MTDSRTREERIADLLDLRVELKTDEDRLNFVLFNSLPDEVKFALLLKHNEGFRNRALAIIRDDILADKEGK